MNVSRTLKVRMTRKVGDLPDLRNRVITDGWYDEVTALVEETRDMTTQDYDAFASDFFQSHAWLEGRGGRNALRQWLVIEVTAPERRALYVDSEGYRYARYVGVAVED